MILELRTYSIRPGRMSEFLAHVETLGMPVAKRVLGGPLGYFTTEIGDLTQVVHLWAYESLSEREQRLSAIFQDGDWLRFIDTVLPLIERMETRILRPAPFSPLTMDAVRSMNAK